MFWKKRIAAGNLQQKKKGRKGEANTRANPSGGVRNIGQTGVKKKITQ